MMRIHVNVETSCDVSRRVLRVAVRRTLELEGASEAEVSLTLMDDEAITAMNREYLGRDRPTDVLAFSLGDDERPLGDIYVGVDQARRQAGEYGVSFEEEMVRLAVHGTLHVLGYDHPDGRDRTLSPMYVRQEDLVHAVLAEEAP